MPILFMALMALVIFGAIGLLLCTACLAEHRQQRIRAQAAGAHVPAEEPLKARAAKQGL